MHEVAGCQVELTERTGKRLSFSSFGLSTVVTLFADCSIDAVLPYLPPSRSPVPGDDAERRYLIEPTPHSDPAAEPSFRVFFEARLLTQSPDLEDCFSALEGDLSMAIATDPRHGFIFVHAGVVSLGEGALLIPGTSRSGKSTLVDALVSEGALYFSDEFAVIDTGGIVRPYLRQLSLRAENSLSPGKKVSLQRFKGRIAVDPLPVTGILGCQYSAETGWDCHIATPGQGVLLLLENAVGAQLDPQRSMKILSQAAQGAKVVIGKRGEASEALVHLWRCFASSGAGEI